MGKREPDRIKSANHWGGGKSGIPPSEIFLSNILRLVNTCFFRAFEQSEFP